MRAPVTAALLAGILLTTGAACSNSPQNPTGPTPPTNPPTNPPINRTGQTATVVVVGDIGQCDSPGVARTARLVERIDGDVLLAGDLAYFQGSMADFLRCFDPLWGEFRRRWRPVPGNHEYETAGVAGYFQYFGEAASPNGRSYYSFRTGDWLVLMLDSNIATRTGTAQFEFVRTELRANRGPCTLAVWHHPLFSSGPSGAHTSLRDLWSLLYENDADVVVAAHDHAYERFGKQDVEGRSDTRGIRQFVAGTGGATLYDFMRVTANSQVRNKAHGVLRLTLNPTNYEWAFIDATGGIADAGSDTCH